MRTWSVAALVGILVLGTALPREANATHTVTFHTTLLGLEEVPPNGSSARGTATAGLNSDNSLTYSVTSTGFATGFRFAHVHRGPAGVAGPILFLLDCNEKGTSCGGTGRPFSAEELDMLFRGDLYVNMHTDAIPSGEIRGQLRLVADVPPTPAVVLKFEGKAAGVGVEPSADKGEVRIKGRFFVESAVELQQSTAVIGVLLDEFGGASELVRGPTGTPTLPIPLVHMRPDRRGKEAVYASPKNGRHPFCRLKLKNKGDGVVEFALECKRGEGTTIPFPPILCTGASRPMTMLRTVLWLEIGTFVAVDVRQPWSCNGRDGNVRELKAVAVNSGSGGGSGRENRPPKADFRVKPSSGTAPLIVSFENRSVDPDGDALTFEWDLGDGTHSAERDPVHTYGTPGEYELRLVVRDARGASSAPKRGSVVVR